MSLVPQSDPERRQNRKDRKKEEEDGPREQEVRQHQMLSNVSVMTQGKLERPLKDTLPVLH